MRAELNAEKEEEKQFEKQANGDGDDKKDEIVKRDYYFNEVIAITVDYVQQLGSDNKADSN
jgi:hypothetical protein